MPTADFRAHLIAQLASKPLDADARAYLMFEAIPATVHAFERIMQAIGREPDLRRRLDSRRLRVLDLGAGHNLLCRLFEDFFGIPAIGADSSLVDSRRMVAANFHEGCPFKSETFDVVTSLAVFEHVWRPRRFLEEQYRIARPGALLYTSTPNFGRIQSRLKQMISATFRPAWPNAAWEFAGRGQFTGHVREYTLEELCDIVRDCTGASIVEAGYHQASTLKRRSALVGRCADLVLAPARLIGPLKDSCHILWMKPSR